MAVVTVVAGLVTIPATALASVHDCHVPSSMAGGEDGLNELVGNLSVRNMSCSEALHAIDIATLLRSGNVRTPHFGCYTLKVWTLSGTHLGAEVRCVHQSPYKAFRFNWFT
jgi:hypothetical protein